MKHLLFLATLLFGISAYAQDIEYDKKTFEVTADGTHVFSIERECDHGTNCRFHVSDVNGKEVLLIRYQMFNSLVERSQANPNGTVRYLEFIFLESEKKAEYDSSVINPKQVAKLVHKNGLFVNGELDATAVDQFVLINGTKFSERVKL